jgi:hypothetical protein
MGILQSSNPRRLGFDSFRMTPGFVTMGGRSGEPPKPKVLNSNSHGNVHGTNRNKGSNPEGVE